MDADAKDLVPRLANDWSLAGLLATLSAALAKRGDEVPAWLSLWTQEEASLASGVETAVFGMT